MKIKGVTKLLGIVMQMGQGLQLIGILLSGIMYLLVQVLSYGKVRRKMLFGLVQNLNIMLWRQLLENLYRLNHLRSWSFVMFSKWNYIAIIKKLFILIPNQCFMRWPKYRNWLLLREGFIQGSYYWVLSAKRTTNPINLFQA